MKTTREYLRTDREIINAFIKLLKTTPFEKITVQDIIDEAMVSRSCFYQHFCDKYEIAERLQDKILSFRKNAMAEIGENKKKNVLNDFDSIFFPNEFVDIGLALMNIHTENVDLLKALTTEFKEEYKAAHENASELECYFYSGIMYMLTLYSIEKNNGKSPLPEEVQKAVLFSAYNFNMYPSKDEIITDINKYIK